MEDPVDAMLSKRDLRKTKDMMCAPLENANCGTDQPLTRETCADQSICYRDLPKELHNTTDIDQGITCIKYGDCNSVKVTRELQVYE